MYGQQYSQENLSRAEEQLLTRQWKEQRNERARNKILSAYDKKARAYASKARRKNLDPDDLLQCARIGLSKALDQFDPDLGNRFGTFAHYYILSEIQLYALEQGSVVRIFNTTASKTLLASYGRLRRQYEDPSSGILHEDGREKICQEIGISMEELLRFEQVQAPSIRIDSGAGGETDEETAFTLITDDNPEDKTIEDKSIEEAHIAIRTALKNIEPRDAKIVYMRFFRTPPMTLEAIGEALNISRERVRQLEIRGMKNLKNALEANGITNTHQFF